VESHVAQDFRPKAVSQADILETNHPASLMRRFPKLGFPIKSALTLAIDEWPEDQALRSGL
jgi:hypothetical protein